MTYIINIGSPSTKEENTEIINFINPLLETKKVNVSGVFWENVALSDANQPPLYRDGYAYYFWFENEDDALSFKLKFNGELIPS